MQGGAGSAWPAGGGRAGPRRRRDAKMAWTYWHDSDGKCGPSAFGTRSAWPSDITAGPLLGGSA